jgi:N-acetylglucosaminyldiphosphoundecaprenol N-acetyl-beta-D-mannosaminyltransferase
MLKPLKTHRKTAKTSLKQGKILKISLNSTSRAQVLAFVRDSIARGYKFWISTPNPEIILQAERDDELAKAIEDSDIAIPDGVGLIYAAKFLGLPKINLIKGREMFMDLVALASKKGWKIFLLGGGPGVAKEAGQNLRKTFKKVRIAVSSGPTYNKEGEPVNLKGLSVHKETLAQINEFAPDLLFVAFGAPKQEKWVFKNLPRLKVGGAMVVGGTFDYIAGKATLPPKWMAKAGLEWLWRLMIQPTRFVRIIKATIIFPLKVLLSRLNTP